MLLRQELVQVLRGVPKKHVAEVAVLKRHYRQRFPLWGLQLAEGFNLLFYGLGSKRTLLQEFVAHAAGRHAVVEVNGYMPWFSMKKLLTTITSKVRGLLVPNVAACGTELWLAPDALAQYLLLVDTRPSTCSHYVSMLSSLSHHFTCHLPSRRPTSSRIASGLVRGGLRPAPRLQRHEPCSTHSSCPRRKGQLPTATAVATGPAAAATVVAAAAAAAAPHPSLRMTRVTLTGKREQPRASPQRRGVQRRPHPRRTPCQLHAAGACTC